MYKDKNFINSDNLPCDYSNFFWLDEDCLEFVYTEDFFYNNFIEIISNFKWIKFDDEITSTKDLENIRKRVSCIKFGSIVKVHIFNEWNK